MVECKMCGAELPEKIICISAELSGDEYTECWYFCEKCAVYTVKSYTETFDGGESSKVYGPIAQEEGDAKVALAKRCATPWEKKCDCDAHKKYFEGMS